MSGAAALTQHTIATGTPTVITVEGRPTRVRVDGDPANPPMLLLHGIGRSLEDWSTQYERFADGYRVIALDVPGFGFSARRPEPATLAALARGVFDTLNALGEHRPLHVVGNSLGGAVAMQLLVLSPERVASLVLVNSAGFGGEVTPLLRMLAVPGLGWLGTRKTTRAAARLLEANIYADGSLATDTRVEHALVLSRQPGSGDFMYEIARELATGRGVKEQWRSQLITAAASHRRPTLVVWGDRDRVLPAHHLDTARRLMPHAETHLFTATGHMPQVERPDEFCGLTRDFLRRQVRLHLA